MEAKPSQPASKRDHADQALSRRLALSLAALVLELRMQETLEFVEQRSGEYATCNYRSWSQTFEGSFNVGYLMAQCVV